MANRIKSCTQVQEDQKAEDTSIRGHSLLLEEKSLYCGEDESQTEMVHADCCFVQMDIPCCP